MPALARAVTTLATIAVTALAWALFWGIGGVLRTWGMLALTGRTRDFFTPAASGVLSDAALITLMALYTYAMIGAVLGATTAIVLLLVTARKKSGAPSARRAGAWGAAISGIISAMLSGNPISMTVSASVGWLSMWSAVRLTSLSRRAQGTSQIASDIAP